MKISLEAVTQFFKCLLGVRTYLLWHPDSPGVRVKVTRTWIGRVFKPTAFATLSEVLAESGYDIYCPRCGYYCLGEGGYNCIDKPSLIDRTRKIKYSTHTSNH